MSLVVQKYGGTSIRDIERIKAVAHRCLATQQKGHDLVVVLSAMAGETNRLLELAGQITNSPEPREMDMLISTGEQVSISLLAITIQALGGKARSFLADQMGMRTDNLYGKARILSVDDKKVRKALEDGEVVIVAGFQGVDAEGNITTLGRGGSDTTAVALAAALHADVCEIYTDVDGIYTTDPSLCADAKKIKRIAYEEMMELASLGAKILQVRSVEFGMNYGVPIHVRSSFEEREGSWVIPEEVSMEKVRVRGVACDLKAAKITIRGVPDIPGVAAKIFRPLAGAGINVDVIIQNVSEGGVTDVTFTVSREDLELARTISQEIVETMAAQGTRVDERVAKVSLVGVGMRSHAGVAAQAFDALAEANINIQMISTSEIKISCVVAEDDAPLAVQVLHGAFHLGSAEAAK